MTRLEKSSKVASSGIHALMTKFIYLEFFNPNLKPKNLVCFALLSANLFWFLCFFLHSRFSGSLKATWWWTRVTCQPPVMIPGAGAVESGQSSSSRGSTTITVVPCWMSHWKHSVGSSLLKNTGLPIGKGTRLEEPHVNKICENLGSNWRILHDCYA